MSEERKAVKRLRRHLVDRARKQKYNQRPEYEKFVSKLIKKKVQNEIYNIRSVSNFNNNISNLNLKHTLKLGKDE